MQADGPTRAFYDREAGAYADRAAEDVPAATRWLEALAALMPPGGAVLDLGCGSGWAADWFAGRGFRIEAVDASAGLAAEARARYGINVTVAAFGSLVAEARYDGVWASFSLLHAPRSAMPGHLARIRRSLRDRGALYLGLKEGAGEARDELGRAYTYYGAGEIEGLLAVAGFETLETGSDTGTGYSGTPCRGLHVLARADG